MRFFITALIVAGATIPNTSAAASRTEREQHRHSLDILRTHIPLMTMNQFAVTTLVVGGLLAGVVQAAAPNLLWGEAAFPMALVGIWMSASAVGVGTIIGLFAETPYSSVSKNSLLTTVTEFKEFMALPEEQQLDDLEQNPDLAEFVHRLAEHLAEVQKPRSAPRAKNFRIRGWKGPSNVDYDSTQTQSRRD